MDFSELTKQRPEKEVVNALSSDVYVARPPDFKDFAERHTKRMSNFMASVVAWSSKLLINTELFTKPASFEDLGGVYETSLKSKCTSCLALPDPVDPWIIRMHVTISAGKTLLINVDMRNLITKDMMDKYSIDQVTSAYMYILHCLTAFNRTNTFYVNIDDSEKLKAARLRLENGTYCLPTYEYIYLDLMDNLNNTHDKVWESTVTHKIVDGNKIVIDNDSLPLPDGPIPYPTVNMHTIEDKFYDLFVYMMVTQDIVGVDVETTGLDTFQDTLVSMGIGFDAKIGFYVSVDHELPKSKALYIGEKGVIRGIAHTGLKLREQGNTKTIQSCIEYMNFYGKNAQNIDREDYLDLVKMLKTKKNIFHNAKFDHAVFLTETGISLPVFMDTMLAHYVGRPGYDDPSKDKRGLKAIAPRELGVEPWKADLKHYKRAEKDLAAAYNVRDICYMMSIAFRMQNVVDSIKPLFYDIEMGFLPVLMDAQREGIGLDIVRLKKLESDLKTKMARIKGLFEKLHEDNAPANEDGTKKKFNINSGPGLKKLFYDYVGIIPPRKCKKCGTKHQQNHFKCVNTDCVQFDEENSAPYAHSTPTGEPSLDKFALQSMASSGCEMARQLMEYRAASKLVTSYTNLDTKIHPLTGKLHPSYNQARTATGRLSSSNPNFQQLPKKAGKYIRSCIVPRSAKHCIISADYAGQEIRILAAYSGDEKLIQAYNPCYKCPNNPDKENRCQLGKCPKEEHEATSRCNVLDIHSYITKQIHGDAIDVPISEIKDHPKYDILRTIAKSVTFSLAYGGSAYGIADKNNIPLAEADAILKLYFETFPKVKEYIHSCQMFVDANGYLPDMVNRVRQFKYAGYSSQEKCSAYYEDYYFSDGLRGLNKQFGRWVRKDRRAATNFPIQSLAASMNKIGSIALRKALIARGLDASIVQFVHDEVVLTCQRDPDVLREVLGLIRLHMTDLHLEDYCMKDHPLGWTWPPYLDMEIDISIGDSYGGLMKPDKYLEGLETNPDSIGISTIEDDSLTD